MRVLLVLLFAFLLVDNTLASVNVGLRREIPSSLVQETTSIFKKESSSSKMTVAPEKTPPKPTEPQDMCDEQLGDAKVTIQQLALNLLQADIFWNKKFQQNLLTDDCASALQDMLDNVRVERPAEDKRSSTRAKAIMDNVMHLIHGKQKQYTRRWAQATPPSRLFEHPTDEPWFTAAKRVETVLLDLIHQKPYERVLGKNIKPTTLSYWAPSERRSWGQALFMTIATTFTFLVFMMAYGTVYAEKGFQSDQNDTQDEKAVIRSSLFWVSVLAFFLTVIFFVFKSNEDMSKQVFLPGGTVFRSDVFASIFSFGLWFTIMIVSIFKIKGQVDLTTFASFLMKMVLLVTLLNSGLNFFISLPVKPEEMWRERLQFMLFSNLRHQIDKPVGKPLFMQDEILRAAWKAFLPAQCQKASQTVSQPVVGGVGTGSEIPTSSTSLKPQECLNLENFPFSAACADQFPKFRAEALSLSDMMPPPPSQKKASGVSERLMGSLKSLVPNFIQQYHPVTVEAMTKVVQQLNHVTQEIKRMQDDRPVNNLLDKILGGARDLIEIGSIAYLCSNTHKSSRLESASNVLQTTLQYLGLLIGALGVSETMKDEKSSTNL
eukprot:c2382_g1_i1.p1 GENE.c2382_g1_i1~~c2382_g1_i1.p1  ORF type:complete len:603 (-),score=148.44 c2382_g1_i1:561-2369(-)